jgi:hypothetical protein
MADCPACQESAIGQARGNLHRIGCEQEKSPFDAMFERAFYLAEWMGFVDDRTDILLSKVDSQ